jgi:hypothetical protein
MISPVPGRPVRLGGPPVDLTAGVTVTLPVWVWVNLLGVLHTGYAPGSAPWADQAVGVIEKAVDA